MNKTPSSSHRSFEETPLSLNLTPIWVSNLIPSWAWDDTIYAYHNWILKFGEAYVISSHLKIPIHAWINKSKVDLIW